MITYHHFIFLFPFLHNLSGRKRALGWESVVFVLALGSMAFAYYTVAYDRLGDNHMEGMGDLVQSATTCSLFFFRLRLCRVYHYRYLPCDIILKKRHEMFSIVLQVRPSSSSLPITVSTLLKTLSIASRPLDSGIVSLQS